MFLRVCSFASFSILERMLLSLTSCCFFLNDSGDCISSLGSHIFLSRLGKIQLPLSCPSWITYPVPPLFCDSTTPALFSDFRGCSLVSLMSRINSATFLAPHFHHSTLLWTSRSPFSSPAPNTFLIFSISILYNLSSVESVSSPSASVVLCHRFKQTCRGFSTSPHHSWAVISRNICKGGLGHGDQHGTTCSLLLEEFVCHVSPYS